MKAIRAAFERARSKPHLDKLEACPDSFALSPTGDAYASPHVQAAFVEFRSGYLAALTRPVAGGDVLGLAALYAERDALTARIKLIEDGVRRAAYDASMRGQLVVVNEARLARGKRCLTMVEFASGCFADEED